jgi:hypothetical protein
MPIIFADPFDNYSVVTDVWDVAGNGFINTNLAFVRTGTQSMGVSTFAGPVKNIVQLTNVLFVTNWYSSNAGEVFRFQSVVGVFTEPCLRVQVNSDGSVEALNANVGPSQLKTAASLVTFNTYNNIAVQITAAGTTNSTINIWVNGVLVATGNNKDTTNSNLVAYCNAVQLMAPGGLPQCYHDDFYVLDMSTTPNNTFLGALKLYALAPTSNGSPVAWVPLANTNWQEVAEAPPDGDTSYVSSGNIGDIDQYQYPIGAVPSNSTIFFVQAELDMRVDSGSRSVTCDLSAVPNINAIALNSSYHIYCFPYDTNPGTTVAFKQADFPLQMGPKVTA